MAKKLFDLDAESRLGIDAVDREHVRLVDMLNDVHALISEGRRDEAPQYLSNTLSGYVQEHFANEEAFMAQIAFPLLAEHARIHQNFASSFQALQPQSAAADDEAFRKALSDAFSWILTHIGKTDRRYAKFYHAQQTQ